MTQPNPVKALAFDVFGTVVDWRGSIAREGEAFGRRHGIQGVDWTAFAMDWRALYQPAMARIRSGEKPFTKLDRLHRMNLDTVLQRYGIGDIAPAELDWLNRAWHRLDPWPDALAGLKRLKVRFILATLSNANVALTVNMARRAGLPWDVILGAEIAQAYKPQPRAYLAAADMLDLPPSAVMMVAAHNADLAAAHACGLRTAFVARPVEYGPQQSSDLTPEHSFYDFCAADFEDLAGQLGC